MKKAIFLFLLFTLCLSLFRLPVFAQTSETAGSGEDGPANSWRYEDGEWIADPYAAAPLAEPSHPDATLTGIDVSKHQGRIDWQKVKDSGIDFAILRCGYGGNYTHQDDEYFLYNATECERLGIPYGVYLYSYAVSTAQAAGEAEHVLRLLQGRTLSYPVYLDMEDNSTLGSDHAAIASTFCSRILAAGHPVGVYANLYWWNTYLTDPCFDNWHRWVAQYNSTCHYTDAYAMWQYSSGGTVPGINGRVDMNFQIGWPADHGAGDPDAPESSGFLRLYGKSRYETAFKTADQYKTVLGVERFDTVIIASGETYPDALAGSYLAHVKNAPLLMARADGSNAADLAAYIGANLAPGGQIYILGGETAVSRAVDAALAGYAVKRLAGATRYETNVLILREAGVTGGDILVCTAQNFADSLSASATGRPILLVNSTTGKLNDQQKEYLSGLNPGTFFILGGKNAIGDGLEQAFKAYGTVERIGGASRFETSTLIAEKFFSSPQSALLTYSHNFPDGLCGGPLAAAMNAPMLLAKTGSCTFAEAYTRANAITEGIVLGGPTLISDADAGKIFRAGVLLKAD